ncbi:MAG TPA: hypothetical protein VFA81_12580 [Burkholderiales bacterium]|nr:hypothetical protein [Burkholderiales bacterium]
MDRDAAERLMQAYMAINTALNEATPLTSYIIDKSEQESIRSALGNLMQSVYLDLMRPLIKQHPDLDPDK